ncbi:MAG: HEAT repeat domain-containing protein [Nostocaceae cyanobacterium]|nr:HEAT repeat domain-containing protein [Nostocaceae cyanobacterium]
MNNNQNLPRKFDAVLGGQVPPPIEGVVLGGLEGVKQRMKSPVARERAATLIDAFRYGEAGLYLLIAALKDSSEQVQLFAGHLLRDKGGEKGKQALLKHNPWLNFTMLEDWKFEDFDPNIGINTVVSSAYSVNLYREEPNSDGGFTVVEDFILDELQALLKAPQIGEIEALACWMPNDPYLQIYQKQCSEFIHILCQANKRLTSLKALFIGDRRQHEYKKSLIYLSDMSPIFEAFPHLEVLKLNGCPTKDSFSKNICHDRIKTLIIETADNHKDSLAQTCDLNLPALEYLELWGGRCGYISNISDSLAPLITGKSFPNLSYLGLPSFEKTDWLVKVLADSPILNRLRIINLSKGTLTDTGAEFLLNSPAINQLHLLNVANNYLSTAIVKRLSQLKCQVIADFQDLEANNHLGNSNSRYYALYE